MKDGLNILIIHAHWNNRGDEAAIRAMIDSLRSSLPINRMKIMMFAEKVIDFPYDDIVILKPYPNLRRGAADSALTLASLGMITLSDSGREFTDAVDEADVVVHAPGGPSVGDIYRGGFLSYEYLYRLFFARVVKKKPVFFYAPSMGPFSCKFDNPLRRFILKRAGAIVVREALSAEYLEKQLGLKSVVTCDSALQNVIPEGYLERYNNLGAVLTLIEEKRIVGMTITDLGWHPIHGKNPLLGNRIRESMVGTVDALIGKGYYILMIPQIFGDFSDVPLLRQYASRNEERIIVLPENVDSYGQQVLISKLHSVIGMRYHSNIFAAKGRTPFISVCYEHKMKGFMETLGLTEYTLDVEDISEQDVMDRFERLESDYERIKRVLSERVHGLQELSRVTTKVVVDGIRRGL